MESYYLVPDINVIYEGRRFKIQLEFASASFKNIKYTFEKRVTDDLGHFLRGHYEKFLNLQMLKDPETVYRDIKFLPEEVVYFDDEFLMRKQLKSEAYMTDILDDKLTELGLSKNYPLELLSEKKSNEEINQILREKIPNDMLKTYILNRLDNQYDLFYWRKRYAQNIAIHGCRDLIFGNHTDFSSIKICFNEGNIINESTELDVSKLTHYAENIFKNEVTKDQIPTLPLRITKNNLFLIKDYMIEGVIYPTFSSMCSALRKVS